MKRTLLLFAVVALGVLLSACSNPLGPSKWDPNKPIGPDNHPPGPGFSQVHTSEFQIFEGDCASAPAQCDPEKEVRPTTDPALKNPDPKYVGTYVFAAQYVTVSPNSGFKIFGPTKVYTVKVCITHPGVQFRQITYGVSVFTVTAVSVSPGNEDQLPSPVCYGVLIPPFNTYDDLDGSVITSELVLDEPMGGNHTIKKEFVVKRER